ncbi:MAG: WXG100 family type VII secretion target [Mycobacteriales bacterium]
MGGIKVTPEMLHTLAGQCTTKAGEIEGSCNALKSQVSAVVGSDWSSSAAEQYQMLQNEWDKSQKQMHEALQGISRLLNNAGNAYSESENAIKSSFQM